MTGFDSAFEQVKILVEHFSANEKMYLAADYSEARVRTDFIDKFFTALGWDVNHNVQLNPYEQEVSIEKPVKVDGMQQKRADYAFFLAPNYRKDDVRFYVEAKKPARNLSNVIDYFQTCRYGWSAGTPLTILTDFEEFHILDCRTKPDINTILDTKRDYFHYKDYLDKEKFAKVYWLFSREAVANNSIEKYVEQLPKLRGKGVQKKRGYESIDEVFLEELDEIRTTLAKAFKKNNPHLGSDELTEMTQRTIDRLVFIRFLEDKQIEPEHYISVFGDSKTAWKDFIYASRKLDAKYNGIVFKKTFIDEKNFFEPNDIDFSSVCEELSHVNSPYNFDLIPIHILGSIYERFLGKVVVATDKRVRIDEKPEVRKAGGVYYTPQYIVNYIVENTVGKLIEGKTPKEIAKLRFADISCGSGSFLITVFDKLLEYHKKFYQNNPKEAKSAGCYEVNGKWVLSLKQKQKILTNNIYGVDIDAQAVEVTQLSLYLKLLEDESNATAEETWVMFKEQILPSLSDNIICGNSLIGTDISSGTLFNWEEEKKLKPMNFEDAFPKIMKAGGFDAVVGNPPYRMVQPHNINEQELQYYKKNFIAASFKIDLFHLFLNKGINSTKELGLLGYIMPTTLLNNVYAEKLRNWILNTTCIKSIATSKERIFEDADVYTSVYVFEKNKNNTGNEIAITFEVKKLMEKNEIEYDFIKQKSFQNNVGNTWNLLLNQKNLQAINKLETNTVKLNTICELNRGLITGDRGRYFSTTKLNEKYLPILAGSDVNRYYAKKHSEYVLFERPKTAGGCWDKEVHLAEHKIIIRQIGVVPTATLLLEKIAVTGNIFTIRAKNNSVELEKYVLAIINSKLIKYFWQTMFADFKNSFPQVTIESLSQIPIKQQELESDVAKALCDLSNNMMELKEHLLVAKTDNEKEYLEKKCKGFDRQIDALVYELYGLTEEEINIVEG